jgi:N4-gp56 family major capsid protein
MSGNAIYSASVISAGLAGYPTVYYDRVAVETLRHNLFLYPALDLKQMPDRSGVAMQIFAYTAMTANTTAATEGAPTTGQALTQVTGTLNLVNYVDYVTYSNLVTLTAISDVVAEGTVELSYRGAFSVDTVIAAQLDLIANSNTASRLDILEGTFMSASVSRHAAMGLRAVDVKPKANGKYYGVIASLSAFDLINDTATGGYIDLEKFAMMGKSEGALSAGIAPNNFIGSVGGVDWYESNALPTETNWESSTSTAYHAYVIGKDGIFGSSLGKTALAQKNFSVKVAKFDQPIAVDPANQIAAASSYNFFFGVVGRPGTVAGFRRIRCQASITS